MYSHIEAEAHQYVKVKNTTDEALLYYAKQKHLQYLPHQDEGTSTLYSEQCNNSMQTFSEAYPQGWARKIRRVRRLTEKQKQFIEKLFQQGAATKSKLSAEQMSDRMRDHMINGEYYFSPDEYLEPSQIRSLISRINKQNKSQQQSTTIMSEDDGIAQNLDEICSHMIDSDEEDFLGFDGIPDYQPIRKDVKFIYNDLHSEDEDFMGFG